MLESRGGGLDWAASSASLAWRHAGGVGGGERESPCSSLASRWPRISLPLTPKLATQNNGATRSAQRTVTVPHAFKGFFWVLPLVWVAHLSPFSRPDYCMVPACYQVRAFS